uniref:Uncharacterized protein n=1 Tax=Vibrio sp. FF_304 TaxID=1652833 RepID=A0A0H3ZZM9_9VIBR|nr:hypothetical protein [Vibrio sp. FF_304]
MKDRSKCRREGKRKGQLRQGHPRIEKRQHKEVAKLQLKPFRLRRTPISKPLKWMKYQGSFIV